jgi:thymidylate synthase (FAD)
MTTLEEINKKYSFIEFEDPDVYFLKQIKRKSILMNLENIGRTCYKSQDKITENSAGPFIKKIVDSGHLSILEHESLTAFFRCSRACSHQLVRHRLCSFTQESQRYVAFKGKIPMCSLAIETIDELTQKFNIILLARKYLEYAEKLNFPQNDFSPKLKLQDIRFLLPNATMTTVIVTANLRQWRHMIDLRTGAGADYEISFLFKKIQEILQSMLPEIFGEKEEINTNGK